MGKNWKTTVLGILALLFTGFKIYSTGTVEPEDVAIITTGGGLIVAKDNNVTGGKVDQ